MVSLIAFFIPLLAAWIWWPVHSLPLALRLAAIVLTTLLGLSPAGLIYLIRNSKLDYSTIAYLQVPSGWCLCVLFLLSLYALLRDGAWLLARLWGTSSLTSSLHSPQLTLGALGVAALIASLGLYHGLRPPQVREQIVQLPQLPPELQGLRIAVIADLHSTPVNNRNYVQTVVERTLAAQPDLIVLPGDLVDGDAPSGRQHVAPLAQLSAPLGVWVAPGNHEYYSGYSAWMAVFKDLGLGLLENRSQILPVKGVRLAVSGVGDPVYGRTSPNNQDERVPEGLPPDVDAVVRQAREGQADFHLLLAHQPKLARDNAGKGIGLQISGHTHGGQIVGMDRWLTAPVNNGFVRGLYDVNGMKLFVSSGAGLWAGFAIRLGVPSSIDLLVLQRSP